LYLLHRTSVIAENVAATSEKIQKKFLANKLLFVNWITRRLAPTTTFVQDYVHLKKPSCIMKHRPTIVASNGPWRLCICTEKHNVQKNIGAFALYVVVVTTITFICFGEASWKF